MISNTLADAQQAHTGTAINPVPPASLAESPGLALLVYGLWALLSVGAAYLLGIFKKGSIRGPERLQPDESVWWLLMILCGSMLVAGRIVSMVGLTSLGLPKESSELVSGDLFELCVFLLVVASSLVIRKDALRLMGLRLRQIPMALAGGLLLILVIFPLVYLIGEAVCEIYYLFHLKQAEPHEVLQMLEGTKDRRVMIIGVVTAGFIAPLFEEMLFRGMFQTLLGRMFSIAFGSPLAPIEPVATPMQLAVVPTSADSKIRLEYQVPPPASSVGLAPSVGPRARWAAVFMTSAAFAASHMQPAWLAPLFLLSVGLGYVYERTGNLWMTIAAHGIFNSAQILLFLYL